MRQHYRMQRLYVESAIAGNEAIAATPKQVHYLRTVLRMGRDDEILIFNGRDGEWAARLLPEGRKSILLYPSRQTRPQTKPADLHFMFAPLKTGRLDYIVQKAAEMGAGLIRPVITRHTQQTRIPEHRITGNLIEAAEQCGLLSIPEAGVAATLDAMLAQWDPVRRLVFCDEAAPPHNPLATLQRLRGEKLALLIGPEGGFSDEERQKLGALSCTTKISLGPRILRADTAAVAALALLQAAAGDW